MGAILVLTQRKELKEELSCVLHGLREKHALKFVEDKKELRDTNPAKVSLAIIDYHLEFDEAFHLLEAVRDTYDGIPYNVILIQRSYDRERILQSAQLGIRGYVLFPYILSHLKDQILSVLSAELLASHSVGEIVKKNPMVLWEYYTIKDAMRHLVVNRLSGSVILNEHKVIVGYISEKDLLDCISILLTDADKAFITDVMRKEVLTLSADTNLADALKFIIKRNLKQVPIVDGRGLFMGMITRFDLLQYILNQGLKV